MPGISKKKRAIKKKTQPPVYLREVTLKYRKKRVSKNSTAGKRVSDSSQVAILFADLQNEAKEKFITVSLNNKMKIISFEVVALGSIAGVSLRPFEAIRSAIALNAHGVIFIHNHPSGDPTPSKQDQHFTAALKDITDKGGMLLLDHIIIGDNRYFSFYDERML